MAETGASIVCHWPVAIITPWFSVFDFNIVGNTQPVSPKSVIISIKANPYGVTRLPISRMFAWYERVRSHCNALAFLNFPSLTAFAIRTCSLLTELRTIFQLMDFQFVFLLVGASADLLAAVIRFFQHLTPASPSVCLTTIASVSPAWINQAEIRNFHVPRICRLTTEWLRSAFYTGGTTSS